METTYILEQQMAALARICDARSQKIELRLAELEHAVTVLEVDAEEIAKNCANCMEAIREIAKGLHDVREQGEKMMGLHG